MKVLDAWSPDTYSDQDSEVDEPSHTMLMSDLPEVKVNFQNMNESEVDQTKQMLSKWKHIISTSFKDLGNTDLVKQDIKLIDEVPLRESYRRIPPGLYEEVRQHL